MKVACTIWLPDENYPEQPILLEPGDLVSDLQDKLEAQVEKKAKLALRLRLLKPSSDLLIKPLDTLFKRIEASLTTADRLSPDDDMTELFGSSDLKGRVQVIAVRAVFTGETEPVETTESDAALDETMEYRESSPSNAAKSSQYRDHQADPRRVILDGRPVHNSGPPVALYHQVFAEFQEDMTKKLTKEDLTTSERAGLDNFIVTASDICAPEDSWRAAMLDIIRKMGITAETPEELSFSLKDCKASCDALIRSSDTAILLLAEIKNLSGPDPAIQGGLLYQTYWTDTSARRMMNVCCCPSFVLAIAGQKICIFGAVLAEKVIIQPLTSTIWMSCDANMTAMVLELACMFRALKAGLDRLRAFYAQLTPSASRAASRFHPCIKTFPQSSADGTANTVELEYKSRLALDLHSSALFEAQCEGKRVVVKFPRTYCPEAHRLLAQHGYAPELVYAAEETRVPDRWMVVMGFVEGMSTYDLYPGGPLPAAVVAEVRKAIAILHDAGWVFGDLRPPNIMVFRAASGLQVQFIDFDWCGKENDEKYLYPAPLNKAITWAPDVSCGTVLRKAHDLHMINELMTTRRPVRRRLRAVSDC